MSINKDIYDLLLEQDYLINLIEILNHVPNVFLQIQLSDDDLIDFKKKVKKSLNINSLRLCKKEIDTCLITLLIIKLDYTQLVNIPSNIYEIKFHDDEDYYIDFQFAHILNNLPNQLVKLYIEHYNYKINKVFNLNNLPANLMYLRLEGCRFNENNEHNYILEDLINLPIGLEKIIINNQKYNSIQELINSFVKKNEK